MAKEVRKGVIEMEITYYDDGTTARRVNSDGLSGYEIVGLAKELILKVELSQASMMKQEMLNKLNEAEK